MAAKEDFSTALWRLLRTRDFECVSVSEVVNVSGRSSASFYRCFHDKYDLLWRTMAKAVCPSKMLDPDKPITRDDMVMFLIKASENRNQFHHALASFDRRAPRTLLVSVWASKIRLNLQNRGVLHDAVHLDMLSMASAKAMVGLLCEWLEGRVNLTVEDLASAYGRGIFSCSHQHVELLAAG